jgi:HK97 family phage major capsid protein
MTLTELQEKRGRLVTQARDALEEIKKNTDEARAGELEARHDAIMSDFDKLEKQIDREQRQSDLERQITEAAEAEARQRRESRRPGADAGEVRQGGDVDYRTAFHEYLKAQGQRGEMSAEARAVLDRGFTQIESRAQTTTAAAGGYTVPQELANILVQSMLAWGPMYDPGVTTELVTAGGGKITMPTVNDTTTPVVVHTQGTTLTDDGGSDVTFGEKQLDAFAFNTEWLRVSKELVDDSAFAMETILGNLLGERLGRRANLELTTGTGSSAPNGIVTASTLGKTAAGTTAITADEIIDLLHSVNPAYRMGPRVRFMFNDSTLAAIRKLKDGQGNYLWQMGNVQAGVPGTLLGYNYSINQAMASIPASASASRVMVFGDFSKYYVRKVGQPLIGAIQDKDFWPGFGIAGYIRFDGELADTAAVKHLITAAS